MATHLPENIGQVVRVRLRQRPRLEFLREKGIYRGIFTEGL